MADNAIQSFRDLDAWKVSMDLTVLVYEAVKHLPSTERFELSSQMRRASVSIPANVAEGQSCGEDGRYVHHLRIAIGSLGELMTHVEISRRLALLPDETIRGAEPQLQRANQVLHGLLRNRRMKRLRKIGNGLAFFAGALWWIGALVSSM